MLTKVLNNNVICINIIFNSVINNNINKYQRDMPVIIT